MIKKIFLFILFLLGFLVRLYKINSPLADWHSWRQADTAAVARNFVKNGYDLLRPRFDDLSNVASGKDNPLGYRFVEFPVYNFVHALFFQATEGLVSFEVAGRLVTIFSSLISAFFLYLIVKSLLSEWLGILTAGFYLFLPFGIFYSRVILPDQMMLMFTLGSIWFLWRWRKLKKEEKNGKVSFFISLTMSALAILTKPYALFLLLPSWLVIFRPKDYGWALFYIFFSFLPFVLWRIWMRQFPEGIPANQWLFNLEGIRFRPAWWRWLFAERLGKLILGYWGLIFLGLGIIFRFSIFLKESLFYAWLAGIFAYFSVFARGNVQHDYYQIIILPVVAVFLAKGFWFLISFSGKNVYRIFALGLAGICLIFSLGFSWYEVRGYYQINHPEIVEVGKMADEILPKEAKVIAPYNGDTAFLYQTNRQGWPVVSESVENLVKKGATHYVSVNFDELTLKIVENCDVLVKSERWVIIDLRTCQNLK
jgi:hypothetical protein